MSSHRQNKLVHEGPCTAEVIVDSTQPGATRSVIRCGLTIIERSVDRAADKT